MLNDNKRNQGVNNDSQGSDYPNQTENTPNDQRSKGGSMDSGDFQKEPGIAQDNGDIEGMDTNK